MKNTRLIEILKTFSSEEMKEFSKFIQSPYYGCKKFVLNFFKEIKKHYPQFDERKIDRRKIFSRLYKGKPYNDGLIRRMTSDLISLTEEFMMIRSFESTSMFRDSCLLHELRMRELNNIFEIKSDRIISKIEELNVQNSSSLHRFFIDNQIIGYTLKHKRKDLIKAVHSGSNALICMFLSALNNKQPFLINEKKTTKENAGPFLYRSFWEYFNYKKFIDSLENNNDKYSDFLKYDYYTNRITQDQNDEVSYRKLKDLLKQNENYLNGVHKYNQYILLSKFCLKQIDKFNDKYIQEYLEITGRVLSEKLFLANSSFLDNIIVRNIIYLSVLQEQFDKAENFIRSYSKHFNPEKKEELTGYSRSLIYFAKKEFEKSLECIARLNFDETFLRFDIRILKIKLFYELNYIDSLFSEIDSFKHFLLKNKLSLKNYYTGGRAFVKYLSGIIRLKENQNKDDLEVLKNNLKKEINILQKEWLLQKIMIK